MTVPSTFSEASRTVAETFLHSVVVVDDRAEYPVATSEANAAGGEKTDDTSQAAPGSRRVSRVLKKPVAAAHRAEDLDAKLLVDGFAAKGLVCAILKPGPSEDPADKTLRTASRSDIVVLGWNIGGDGEITCQLVEKILASDENDRRLRLIAIYTGERDIRGIAETIRKRLNRGARSMRFRRDGAFAMNKGAVRIVVFAKDATQMLARDVSGRKRIVKEEDLADRLVGEFAAFAGGLVPNVTLKSLAALRANTHRILGRLWSSLDPGYLWHRAVQTRPSDAEDHLVALVAAEMRSVLDAERVGEAANMETIALWLARDGITDYGPQFGESAARSVADVCELLREGAVGESDKSKAAIQKFRQMKREAAHKKTSTLQVFAKSVAEATRSNEQLAEVMSLRTNYASSVPRLQLGTILAHGKGAKRTHWLCMQPRCDSVRLEGQRAFPLLPLRPPGGNNRFSFVLPSRSGQYLKLVVAKDPYEIRMIRFSPKTGDNDTVTAKVKGKGFRFDAKGGHYDWVGNLKEDHAQRIANELAFQFARIGLTESEWLLLWSTKG